VKKTNDYVHRYRGYWSKGGRCRIRIYGRERCAPLVISQPPDNLNTSVTNLVEYLAAEVIEEHGLPTPWYEWSTIPITRERSVSTQRCGSPPGDRGGASGRVWRIKDRFPH
jgi:hypothetical protein